MSTVTRQIYEDLESLPPAFQEEVLDFIRLLKVRSGQCAVPSSEKGSNGWAIAQGMDEIARRGTAFMEIEDPIAWQRELRKDRTLPE